MSEPRLICHEEDCPALCQENYCAVPTHYARGSATNDRHSYACTCRGKERLALMQDAGVASYIKQNTDLVFRAERAEKRVVILEAILESRR